MKGHVTTSMGGASKVIVRVNTSLTIDAARGDKLRVVSSGPLYVAPEDDCVIVTNESIGGISNGIAASGARSVAISGSFSGIITTGDHSTSHIIASSEDEGPGTSIRVPEGVQVIVEQAEGEIEATIPFDDRRPTH